MAATGRQSANLVNKSDGDCHYLPPGLWLSSQLQKMGANLWGQDPLVLRKNVTEVIMLQFDFKV